MTAARNSGPARTAASPEDAFALLLVDFINPLDFPEAEELRPAAETAAACTAKLKKRAKAAGWPVIYAN